MKNVGSFDASIRIVLGIAALYFGFVAVDAMTKWALYIAALILIWTGWTGSCFIYSLMGINTCEPEMKPMRHEVHIAPAPVKKAAKKKVVKRRAKKKAVKKKPAKKRAKKKAVKKKPAKKKRR